MNADKKQLSKVLNGKVPLLIMNNNDAHFNNNS